MTVADAAAKVKDEAADVLAWRAEELKRYVPSLSYPESLEWAARSDLDVNRVRVLIAAGCDPLLALSIA